MAFNIKVIVEAEAVESSSEITQDYGLSESMMRCWRRDQVTILSGKLNTCRNGPFHSQVSQTR